MRDVDLESSHALLPSTPTQSHVLSFPPPLAVGSGMLPLRSLGWGMTAPG